jgi:hypothetical protein
VKPLSPSSRLVLAVLAIAFVILAAAGAMRPQAGANAGLGVAAGTSPSDAGAFPSAEPSSPATTPAPGTATARPTAKPTPKPSGCKPTDQDRYVYNPSRLAVQARCIRVTGTVEAIRREADGDLHILLALDRAYARLLTPANQGEELGDLVVEPVCVRSVTQADALGTCSSDPDPYRGFDCIASFWTSTNGYVVQCGDQTFSHSGGRQGVCSRHGGYYRTLYSH